MPGGFVRIADDRRCARSQLAAAAPHGRRLGAVRRPVAEVTLLPTPERIAISAPTGLCRAVPPPICSGSVVIWSAPKRRCGWCAH